MGMLDAWGGHPVVAETLREASRGALGEDVGALIHAGPKEALALTTTTQPVMLVAGIAAWRVWCAEGGTAGCRGRALPWANTPRWWPRVFEFGPGSPAGAHAPPPCRRPCPWGLAPWRPSSDWSQPR